MLLLQACWTLSALPRGFARRAGGYARVLPWAHRSLALGGLVYAAVIATALVANLGQSESALPPPPERAWALSSDAGSLGAIYPLEPHASASTCPECHDFDETLLSPLRSRPGFHVTSSAAYVYDQSCDMALYGKNEDLSLAPASLTKMMTALITVEHVADLEQRVWVETSASRLAARTGSSVMGLEPGMEVTVRDLLYGLMLPSGNDAALELARFVAGDVDAFVELMNAKAEMLGLSATRFANPHGLDALELHSTARDLTRLGEAMMEHPLLAEIAGAADYTPANGPAFRNVNRMLAGFPGAFGVKTGYTENAGHTIVAAVERDGRRIYVSVLGSTIPYADATALLDWAFSQPSC